MYTQGTAEMRPVLYIFLGVLIVGSLFQLCIVRRRNRSKAAAGRGGRRSWDEEQGRQDYGSTATARLYE